ncbi:hypothetical protein V8E55_009700 [Tylopilus felleus]
MVHGHPERRWDARRRDPRVNGADLYVVRVSKAGVGAAKPCWRCVQWCAWSGVKRIFHWDPALDLVGCEVVCWCDVLIFPSGGALYARLSVIYAGLTIWTLREYIFWGRGMTGMNSARTSINDSIRFGYPCLLVASHFSLQKYNKVDCLTMSLLPLIDRSSFAVSHPTGCR